MPVRLNTSGILPLSAVVLRKPEVTNWSLAPGAAKPATLVPGKTPPGKT
jgi:hypothetical protein